MRIEERPEAGSCPSTSSSSPPKNRASNPRAGAAACWPEPWPARTLTEARALVVAVVVVNCIIAAVAVGSE
jgi:hypothetical protein